MRWPCPARPLCATQSINAAGQLPTCHACAALLAVAQAPEVVQGGKASAASDVFSFGMVMLELLTWRLPWRDAPVWEVRRRRAASAMHCWPRPLPLKLQVALGRLHEGLPGLAENEAQH